MLTELFDGSSDVKREISTNPQADGNDQYCNPNEHLELSPNLGVVVLNRNKKRKHNIVVNYLLPDMIGNPIPADQ